MNKHIFISSDYLQTLKQLTNNNDHTGARVGIARLLAAFPEGQILKPYMQILDSVELLHRRIGHLPSWLADIRSIAFDNMIEDARLIYNSKAIDSIMECL